MSQTLKIAITGPESTGKSWLAEGLASHYQAPFVPEYARTYIDGLSRDYEKQDLLQIAKGQIAAQQEMELQAPVMLLCDTELIVIKVWSLHKYGTCDPFILSAIERQDFDLYLLCNIDLPWEFDEQREHPHLRQFFLNWYQKELEYYGFPYAVVRGLGEERLMCAVEAVEKVVRCEK
ncbi:MAG: ATP-binding protein [Bacteroides sp.]|nr:ATP-binding protein [Bacteroides sp.]